VVVSVEDERREDTTYNFEIADFHTYYVTEFGVLVHNCDTLPVYQATIRMTDLATINLTG